MNSSSNFNNENVSGILCDELDHWFYEQLDATSKTIDESDLPNVKTLSTAVELQHQLNKANNSSPQHDVHALSNQLFLLERLHVFV